MLDDKTQRNYPNLRGSDFDRRIASARLLLEDDKESLRIMKLHYENLALSISQTEERISKNEKELARLQQERLK